MRIGKLYKMLKLFRLLKILRQVKMQSKVLPRITEKLRIDLFYSRIYFSGFYLVIFLHLAGCLFAMIGKYSESIGEPSWLEKYANDYDDNSIHIYVMCIYFVLTTTTTVGYGDIMPQNTYEKGYCFILMLIGVSGFSFIIGSIGSILSAVDTKEANLSENLIKLQ